MSILTEATHHRLNWLSKHCTEQGAAHGAISFEILNGGRYWTIRATGHPACDEWMVNPIARGQHIKKAPGPTMDAVLAWWASLADEWDAVRAQYLTFRARVALSQWERDRDKLDELAAHLWIEHRRASGGILAGYGDIRPLWALLDEPRRQSWRQVAATALRWVDHVPGFDGHPIDPSHKPSWMGRAAATADASTKPAAPASEG